MSDEAVKIIEFPKTLAGQPVKLWKLKRRDSDKVEVGMLISRAQIRAVRAMKPEERLSAGVTPEMFSGPVFKVGGSLPTTAAIKGVQGVWGIETNYSGVLGAASVMRIRSKLNSEKDYLFDDVGFKSAIVFFDDTEEVNLELVMSSSTTLPGPGDELTADALTFLVMDSERNWDNKGWKKLTVNATFFPNVALT